MTIQSFDWGSLQLVRDVEPAVPVVAISSFGASAFSPVQGTPQCGRVSDPDFELYVTQKMIDDAHASGIRVIPWTVDDPKTMHVLIDWVWMGSSPTTPTVRVQC